MKLASKCYNIRGEMISLLKTMSMKRAKNNAHSHLIWQDLWTPLKMSHQHFWNLKRIPCQQAKVWLTSKPLKVLLKEWRKQEKKKIWWVIYSRQENIEILIMLFIWINHRVLIEVDKITLQIITTNQLCYILIVESQLHSLIHSYKLVLRKSQDQKNYQVINHFQTRKQSQIHRKEQMNRELQTYTLT